MKKNLFTTRLIFFSSPESFGGEVRKVEQKIQQQKLADAKAEEGEKKGEKKEEKKAEDIVDESIVDAKIAATETAIQRSPISEKFKTKIRQELQTLLGNKKEDLQKVDIKKEAQLKTLYAQILKDIDQFNEKPKVKEIYEVVEPFFAKKELIAPIIALKSYNKNGAFWTQINDNLDAMGIDQDLIKELQTVLKIPADGKMGPGTINAVSDMLELGIKCEIGNKTVYQGQTESEEERMAREGEIDAMGEIPDINPEVAIQIFAAANQLGTLEHNVNISANQFVKHLTVSGKSQEGYEKTLETYLVDYRNIISKIIKIRELAGSMLSEDVLTIKLSNFLKSNKIKDQLVISNLVNDPAALGGITIKQEELPVVNDPILLQEHYRNTENALLITRRQYYLDTLDPAYRTYFDQAQNKITGTVQNEVDTGLAEANKADAKESGVDAATKEKLQGEIKLTTNQIIKEFDGIQRMAPGNPKAAYDATLIFREKLLKVQGGNGTEYGIDLNELKKLPNLNSTLNGVVDAYVEQSQLFTVNIITQNPDVKKYQEDFSLYTQRTELFIQGIQTLFAQIKGGKEIPSEHVMDVFHEGARGVLDSPLRKRLEASPVKAFLKSLTPLKGAGEFEKQINDVQQDLNRYVGEGDQYLESVRKLAEGALSIKGSTSKALTMFKEQALIILPTIAAIAVTLATGGTGAALAFPALARAMSSPVISAAISALAATTVSKIAEAAIEKDFHPLIDVKGFAVSWAESATLGLVFKGGSKLLGLGNKGLHTVAERVVKVPKVKVPHTVKHYAHHGQHAAKDYAEVSLHHAMHAPEPKIPNVNTTPPKIASIQLPNQGV